MKRSSYRPKDYSFGQLMLTLRTAIGLTQAALAQTLGVSRQSVADWEAGGKYPKVEHLRAFILLAVQQGAFPAGREADEIRLLWKAARPKVLLDEAWLEALLAPPEETVAPVMPVAVPVERRIDWNDAITVPSFLGREQEQQLLSGWIIEQRCRVINVVGMGGIGKSALAVNLMHQVAADFEVVIWRSLRDMPDCDTLLDSLLQVVAPHALMEHQASLERRQSILLDCLRSTRVLLVLDNLETVLEEGEGAGRMRPAYAGFGRILSKCAETAHRSCLLLTSREKPADLAPYEGGSRLPVQTLRLAPLDRRSCEQLLDQQGVVGSAPEHARLIEAYAGNPLALKIVAQTIVDLFLGELTPFLEQGEVIFGGIREMLAAQFNRLSAVEQSVMLWLAIVREPATLDELLGVMAVPVSRVRLLEAIEALHRRSLIERGHRPGSFTLQSVVLEYATAQLIAEISAEISSGKLNRLVAHGIQLAQAREYVRQTQERLLVAPILNHLRGSLPWQMQVDDQLLALLDHLRTQPQSAQGYAPANLVMLLRLEQGHLRGLDMSQLMLRGMSLQGVEMQDASLAGAFLMDSVFTETFDAMMAVDISSSGEYWAASSRRGEVRVWSGRGLKLHRAWRAHMDMVWTLAFNQDGSTLATGSWDRSIKVWDVAAGELLWTGWHTAEVVRLAFSPDGRLLATNGGSEIILWDAHSGQMLDKLPQPITPTGIAWSRDGRFLVNSDVEGNIRIWSPQLPEPTRPVQTIAASPLAIPALDISADGQNIVAACTDGSVQLRSVQTGELLHTFEGHTERVRRVVWSPDGHTIASAGRDRTIWLWDFDRKICHAVLYGHTAEVCGLAFSPDSQHLFTTSIDGTLRVWDTASGRCIRVILSYAMTIFSVDWSPDSTRLISGGMNAQVTIWDESGAAPPQVLSDDSTIVCSLGWSPDGRYVATSEWYHAIRLWDPVARTQVAMLQPPDDNGNIFYNLAWSPDGQYLAWGTYQNALMVFDVTTGSRRVTGTNFPTRLRHVEWSPDGRYLAGCGYNSVIYIWAGDDLRLVQEISGHKSMIMCLGWNADGIRLAAGGVSTTGGELSVWNIQRGEPETTITGIEQAISAVVWDADEDRLITGSTDGQLRRWDVQQGVCIDVRQAHEGIIQALRRSPDKQKLASCGNDGAIMLWNLQTGAYLQTLRRDRPYERLNITGIAGLSDVQKHMLSTLGAVEAGAG